MEDINFKKHLNITYENNQSSESIKNILINKLSKENKDIILLEITEENMKNESYITKKLKDLHNEMERRYKIFWESDIRTFSEYNIKKPEKLNTIILVLHDCLDQITKQKSYEEIIVKLLQKSNHSGIHIWNINTREKYIKNNLFERWMIEEIII